MVYFLSNTIIFASIYNEHCAFMKNVAHVMCCFYRLCFSFNGIVLYQASLNYKVYHMCHTWHPYICYSINLVLYSHLPGQWNHSCINKLQIYISSVKFRVSPAIIITMTQHEHHGIANHQHLYCLFKSLFINKKHQSSELLLLCHWGFPSQRANHFYGILSSWFHCI